MSKPLHNLKAEDGTTTERPALRIVFVPRFWGSQERRYELGKDHLVPQTSDRGWNVPRAHTLCGKPLNSDTYDGELIEPKSLPADAPIPKGSCKRCAQIATKRGYGR